MINNIFESYGKKRVFGAIFAAALLTTIIVVVFFDDKATAPDVEVVVPVVTLKTVGELSGTHQFSSVGTVVAVSEARLQTESGGRITGVTTEIGATVRAGQVIASIENNSERAALLQAEGAYEAAVAGAKQSDSGSRDATTGQRSAEDAAGTAIRNSLNEVNSVFVNSIDPFFSNPESSVPGLRIDANTSLVNAERVAFQSILKSWKTSTADIGPANLKAKLDEAERNTVRTIALVEQFVAATNAADTSDLLAGKAVTSYTAGLLTEVASLNATVRSLQSARSALISAEEAVVRSSIAASGGTVSLADAQVKIALGSLRAAQAAYEKTLVRTPITGVVNALYLKAGEYVSPNQPAAIVANNDGLEISTAVGQEDSAELAVGDSVAIDNSASGTITAIAGAIDPTTGKVAVKVSVDKAAELQNGSTVSLLFTKKNVSQATEISLPLSAIKMTGSGPVVFTLGDNSSLSGRPVKLGAIAGERVVVTEGLDLAVAVVVDARGLKEGQVVTITK